MKYLNTKYLTICPSNISHEVARLMAELTLPERICMVIAELLQFVADLIDCDFASLVQSLMQKGDQQSELVRLKKTCETSVTFVYHFRNRKNACC
jgi:hypothetical protein